MKGALDLVLVASELQRRGVPFRLSICGAGTLEGAMKEQIARRGLERVVTMRGVLPFNDELLPFVREADVFLSCHKQGDPSCTYLETFACGVPMVGYLNEAFAGLLARVDAGWGIPMHDVRAMADVVERLSRERAEIATKARRAAAFARQHTFESTFARRTAFFRECAAIRSW
jgi:glycosyltransferase involved in cell wall biosynthesis